MIKIFIKVITLKNNESEFQQILSSLIQKFENEEGYISAEFSKNFNNQWVFDFLSEWKTMEDLNRHVQGHYFSVLLGALRVLCKKPDIRIDLGTETLGMDFIQKIRVQQ